LAQITRLRAGESTYLTCETQLLGVIAYLVRIASLFLGWFPGTN